MFFLPIPRYDRLRSGEINKENEPEAPGIFPVPRTKDEAKRSYDRISRYSFTDTILIYSCPYSAYRLSLLLYFEVTRRLQVDICSSVEIVVT